MPRTAKRPGHLLCDEYGSAVHLNGERLVGVRLRADSDADHPQLAVTGGVEDDPQAVVAVAVGADPGAGQLLPRAVLHRLDLHDLAGCGLVVLGEVAGDPEGPARDGV